MKRSFFLSLPAITLLLLAACQADGEGEQSQEKEYTVSVTARIGKQTQASKARYAQTNETNAQFTEGDDIGVFMDDKDAVQWKYGSITWTTSQTTYWDDNNKKHTFHAYYPYTGSTAESKESIQMPALSQQDGTWEGIPKHDFLVASKTLSYSDDNGNVAFTGDNAFKHVSVLLKINVVNEGDMAEATINQILLEGNDLVTQTYYSFGDNSVTTGTSTQNNALSIEPSHTMAGQDAPFYFIVNETGSPIDFTIKYASNDKVYTAHREELISETTSGYIYEYNIKVQGGTVIITGGEISGWTPGNDVENIIINGEEVKDSGK